MSFWGWVLLCFVLQLEPEIPLGRLQIGEMFRPSLPESLPLPKDHSDWGFTAFGGQKSGFSLWGAWGRGGRLEFTGKWGRDYTPAESGAVRLFVSRETGVLRPFFYGDAFASRREGLSHRFQGSVRLGLGIWVEDTYGEITAFWESWAWGRRFAHRRHFAGGEVRLYSLLTSRTMLLIGGRGRTPLDPAPEWEGTFFNRFFFKIGRGTLWLGGAASLGSEPFMSPQFGGAWAAGEALLRGSWEEGIQVLSLFVLPLDREVPIAPFLGRVRVLTLEFLTPSGFFRYQRFWPRKFVLLGPGETLIEVRGFAFGRIEVGGEVRQPAVVFRGKGEAQLFGRVYGLPVVVFSGDLWITYFQRVRMGIGGIGRGTFWGFQQKLSPLWIPRFSLALHLFHSYTLSLEVENPFETRNEVFPGRFYSRRRFSLGFARETTF